MMRRAAVSTRKHQGFGGIMYWFYVLIVAPLLGMISAQFLMISGLSLINFLIAVIGMFKGKVAITNLVIATAISFFNCIMFATLLVVGRYLIQRHTSFCYNTSEYVTYLVFAVLSVWFMAEQFASKIQKQWRNCTVEGSVELDILKRNL